jgi:hypothetical protein
MTKPVTEFVAYLPAGAGPALGRHWAVADRAGGQLARETAGAEGLRDRYNSPLTSAAGRFIKRPREVMRRAAGRKRHDAKAARCALDGCARVPLVVVRLDDGAAIEQRPMLVLMLRAASATSADSAFAKWRVVGRWRQNRVR